MSNPRKEPIEIGKTFICKAQKYRIMERPDDACHVGNKMCCSRNNSWACSNLHKTDKRFECHKNSHPDDKNIMIIKTM